MPDLELVSLIKPAAFLLVVALFLYERYAPAAPREPDVARLGRNVGFLACNVVLSLAVVVPLTQLGAGHGPGWRPAWWSGTPGLILDLLVLDLWVYGWHRANHRVAFLWRFHQVHHRDKALDVTTALRFHPGEVLLSALARAPVILVLAIPLSSVVVFEALVLAASAFHHSNWNIGPGVERVLSRFIVTPGIHWVHHHDRQADTDSNYATILSVWDRLFASRSPTERSPGMTLGVENADELSFVRLAALPFDRPG